MPTKNTRYVTLCVALLACAAAALIAATPAGAGTYTVTQCSSIAPSPGQASWIRSNANYEQRSRCGTGDGLQVFHDAEHSDYSHYGAWTWRAPAGTVFTNVQANASLTYQAGHRGQLIAVRPNGELIEFGAEHNDFRAHAVDGEFIQFNSWLRCVGGHPCGRAGDHSAHAYVRGVFLRTEDRAAPSVGALGGSLLSDAVVRGVRGVGFAATDAGAGIRRVFVEANGALLANDLRNCALAAGFATALSPCPATTSEAVAVPTAHSAFATGPGNVVRTCVEDLALDGAPNRTCERRELWVDNACPGSPVAGATELSASFSGGMSGVVRSDEQGVVRGRLGGPAGAIGGATVCALTRDRVAGAPVVVAATASAAPDGSYELRLPPGPGREVFVHHVSGERVVARHGLVLDSVARPTLAVSPKHRARRGRLHFAGTIPSPVCANRVVKVQARIGKRRWQVFRTDRADAGCRFTARYRLRATREARTYRFRALVPEQTGYPYLRGHSATAKVGVGRDR
jgi:hypothetical protein